jgi:hypothetical protein
LGDRISRLLTADRHEQAQLAFLGLHLGDVDVDPGPSPRAGSAEWIVGKALLGGSVALDLRQPTDSVPCQATVQGRAGQVRDGGLQAVEAVVQRQERVPAKRDDDRLFLGR